MSDQDNRPTRIGGGGGDVIIKGGDASANHAGGNIVINGGIGGVEIRGGDGAPAVPVDNQPLEEKPAKARRGGRKPKWEYFFRLACEILKDNPATSWEDVAAKHNRRYSTREQLDGKKARKIYSEYKQREQNHD